MRLIRFPRVRGVLPVAACLLGLVAVALGAERPAAASGLPTVAGPAQRSCAGTGDFLSAAGTTPVGRRFLEPPLLEFRSSAVDFPRMVAIDSTALDSIITRTLSSYHIAGLAACAIKGDRMVWTHPYGQADTQLGVAVTSATLFMLASISKTFVATAIMQLYEDGLLGLDDDINDVLPFPVTNPYYPDVAITLRMILAHASSIAYNADAWLPLITWGADSPLPLGEYLEEYFVPGGIYYSPINYNPYPPGSGGEYSNEAYALAGYLVEQVSGQPFEQYCQERIFGPLGMPETSWFLAELDQDHIAVPTGYASGMYVPYGHFGFPVYPCGQLRTSAPQLARHLIAFMQGGQIGGVRILQPATVEMMMTIQYPGMVVLPGLEWGLGWFRTPIAGGYLWGHTGGIYGVTTFMYCDPAAHYGFLCLTNADGSNGHSIIANAMYDFARHLPAQTPVFLASFTAERQGLTAWLTWRTTESADLAGFRIWRLEPHQAMIQITPELITGAVDFAYRDPCAPAGSTEYWLQGVAETGATTWVGSARLETLPLRAGVTLAQNFPNPFNPITTISLTLPEIMPVTLSIHDVQGRCVVTLFEGIETAGAHSYTWGGTDKAGRRVASGVYYYCLQAGSRREARALTVLD